MATPREVRRLAFQVLFQLDARGPEDAGAVAESTETPEGMNERERRRAIELADAAFADRARADAQMKELAPTWPAHRQPAADRAILRLAHFEMVTGGTAPKIVVNEAVELAKEFGTEKSPSFVNGLLDKVLKKVLAGGSGATPKGPEGPGEEPPSQNSRPEAEEGEAG